MQPADILTHIRLGREVGRRRRRQQRRAGDSFPPLERWPRGALEEVISRERLAAAPPPSPSPTCSPLGLWGGGGVGGFVSRESPARFSRVGVAGGRGGALFAGKVHGGHAALLAPGASLSAPFRRALFGLRPAESGKLVRSRSALGEGRRRGRA